MLDGGLDVPAARVDSQDKIERSLIMRTAKVALAKGDHKTQMPRKPGSLIRVVSI